MASPQLLWWVEGELGFCKCEPERPNVGRKFELKGASLCVWEAVVASLGTV